MPETAPGDVICQECFHPKDHHLRPGLCRGKSATGDVLTGSACICPHFKAPRDHSREGSRTWDPERDSKPRGRTIRFDRTSSRHEIGDGRLRSRPNIQDSQLTHVGTARDRETKDDIPEWVMFGVRHPDGTVTIHASTGLSYIKLRQDENEFDRINRKLIENGVLTEAPWELNARLVGTMEMDAENYVEALRRLMNAGWQNGGTPEQEPTTADLQLRAALEDAAVHGTIEIEPAYTPADEDVVEAEIVEDDQ